MVQTAAAGRALTGMLPGMSAGQRRSVAVDLGAALARLHSVEVGGFYRRHADGRFDFTELAALQAADPANRLDDLRFLSRARLTAAQVRRAEDLLPEATSGPCWPENCGIRYSPGYPR